MPRGAVALALLLANTSPVFAHSAARGFVMLLPTGNVIVGGTLAVLITFCIVSVLPNRQFRRAGTWRARLSPALARYGHITSLLSGLTLATLIWIGLTGTPDPLENLLPLTVWTVWWGVIVLLHAVFGNVWSFLNPFTGLHALINRMRGGGLQKPLKQYPERLQYLPAFLIFAAFAWFQLVYPGPEDPRELAIVVAIYAVFTLLAVCLFGPTYWLGKGDPFAIFLSQVGAAAPIQLGQNPELKLPGTGLLEQPVLPLMGALFVLLTLSSISFDGFSNTFLWLTFAGVNPLDYPGRTALTGTNTWGLIELFLLLTLIYLASIAAGWIWAGRPGTLSSHFGRFVYALIPISIAFHFAHYLSDIMVNLQYFAVALNDPFSTGASLLGLNRHYVTASFQNTASGALALFAAQTTAIIIGHIIAVAVAHMLTIQLGLSRKMSTRFEVPLAVFMVLYTAFGLWLLSTPAIS